MSIIFHLWKQLDAYTGKLICRYEESADIEVTLERTLTLLKT